MGKSERSHGHDDADSEDTAATAAASVATPALGRWRRTMVQGVRQNLLPWVAVKAVLTALVFAGQVGVWTAFWIDTAVSLLVLAYSWWLARR
jgi:cation transport ATPase